ncbi:uncharacterized protein LOC132601614 [Lycium barbarum]|uniref:uncharacterized protein LOC132601614 n=1 Tax=Lycium barbarum TaxID=112863 RepID=UPI00293EACE7|nr:uncharacterized protein LOC132601614 [Lycium barbarum]
MEYFQRELDLVAENPRFKFHPRCKKLGIMHICFADDLLMFCKAEVQSIQLMQEAFHKFSTASGLQANIDKSSIYFCGVKDTVKADILQNLGFSEGTLPFKYLGVSLSSKNFIVPQCMPLVEKVTERIKCWSAKLLSYAGRLKLIKSVFFGLQTYWAQIFILPKKIMKLVNGLCRTFLWTGSTDNSKKNRVIRKILEARKFVLQVTSLHGDLHSRLQSMVSQSKFSIKKILATVDRLLKFGVAVPATCVSCGLTDETLPHLFFDCNTTKTIWTRLLIWLGLTRTVGTWEEELAWTLTWAKRKSGKGEMVCTLFALVIALVWRERNRIRFQNGNFRVDMLCREMAIHIHTRGAARSTWGVELSKLQGYP